MPGVSWPGLTTLKQNQASQQVRAVQAGPTEHDGSVVVSAVDVSWPERWRQLNDGDNRYFTPLHCGGRWQRLLDFGTAHFVDSDGAQRAIVEDRTLRAKCSSRLSGAVRGPACPATFVHFRSS